jgi:hypothetical protein
MRQSEDATLEQQTKELVQVGHMLNMLAELPPFMWSADLPGVVRAACMESLAINIRLAFEFFFGARNNKYILVGAYVRGWTPPADMKARLIPWNAFANQHCVHLSRRRITPSGKFTVSWDRDNVATLVATVFDLADDFANALVAQDPDLGALFTGFVSTARERARTAMTLESAVA